MTNAQIRTKRTHKGSRAVLQQKHRRGTNTPKYRRAGLPGKKQKEANGHVALLSQSFLDSVNLYIQKIECSKIVHTVPLTSAPYFRDENSLDFKAHLIGMIDIPELDEYDWNPIDFKDNFVKSLNEHFGCDDIIAEDDDDSDQVTITIKALKDEQEWPQYFVLEWVEMQHLFRSGYGLMALIMLVFLRSNGLIDDIARGYADSLQDMAIENRDYELVERVEGEEGEEVEEIISNIKEYRKATKFALSWEIAQSRIDNLYGYLKTDIDLKQIAALIYEYEPFNERLGDLSATLCNLQDFAKTYKESCADFLSYDNLESIIVWYGNTGQYDSDCESVNESFGNEGIKIEYRKGDREGSINPKLIALWDKARAGRLPDDLIYTYHKLLLILNDESIITAFTGLCDKSDFVTALYRKLDGMPGGDQGGDKRWESLGVSPGLTGVFKAAYRSRL